MYHPWPFLSPFYRWRNWKPETLIWPGSSRQTWTELEFEPGGLASGPLHPCSAIWKGQGCRMRHKFWVMLFLIKRRGTVLCSSAQRGHCHIACWSGVVACADWGLPSFWWPGSLGEVSCSVILKLRFPRAIYLSFRLKRMTFIQTRDLESWLYSLITSAVIPHWDQKWGEGREEVVESKSNCLEISNSCSYRHTGLSLSQFCILLFCSCPIVGKHKVLGLGLHEENLHFIINLRSRGSKMLSYPIGSLSEFVSKISTKWLAKC